MKVYTLISMEQDGLNVTTAKHLSIWNVPPKNLNPVLEPNVSFALSSVAGNFNVSYVTVLSVETHYIYFTFVSVTDG